MAKRVPIAQALKNMEASAELIDSLQTAVTIRQFASTHLLLPENNSYLSYVHLDREFVLWNVFATPSFSLQPVESCFLIVGCLKYRGYYAKKDAQDFAHQLQKQGHDVFVGGVAAYSTLGWFDDPLVSPMLAYGEVRLAEVIFHELAHQLIYLKDDSDFNEAFASSIGRIGVRRWLQEKGRSEDLIEYDRELHKEDQFIALMLSVRQQLNTLFSSNRSASEMQMEKDKIYAELQQQYVQLKARWENDLRYDHWVNNQLNNAKLASLATYYDRITAFDALYQYSDQNLQQFYTHIRKLGELPKAERQNCLTKLKQNPQNFVTCF